MERFAGWQVIQPTWRHAGAVAEWALAAGPGVLGTMGAQPFAVTVVSSWFNREGVRAVLLVDEGRTPVAYGEVWDNLEEDESELCHLLASPAHHSAGVYRRLVEALLGSAREDGRSRCVVRLVDTNDELAYALSAMGFRDVGEDTVAAWNRELATSYRWLEHPDFPQALAQ